jgi:hypothetical protein
MPLGSDWGRLSKRSQQAEPLDAETEWSPILKVWADGKLNGSFLAFQFSPNYGALCISICSYTLKRHHGSWEQAGTVVDGGMVGGGLRQNLIKAVGIYQVRVDWQSGAAGQGGAALQFIPGSGRAAQPSPRTGSATSVGGTMAL